MPGPVFIDGDDVALRTAEREDLDFLQQSVNDPVVWQSIGRQVPVTADDEESWYENVVVESDDVHLLACVDDDPVGIVGLNDLNEKWGTAELGYWIAPEYHGNGYATAAGRLLVEYGFAERRLHKVYAKAFAFNDASQLVLEKLGFEREGVHREQAFIDGEHVDVYRYGLLADD